MAPQVIVVILAVLVGIPLAVAAVVYLVVPLFKAIGWLVRQVFRFIFGELGDALHLIGTVITSLVLIPLTIGNIVIGRWSASAHYGRAIQGEMKALGRCCYRILIGHPARLFCLTPLTEGLEKRIPAAVAAAPGADRPSKRTGQFDGYRIVGSLQGGGSGGRLYVAEPGPAKLAAFARNGEQGVDKVVIKCFSLGDGSSLPQIVRENRALDAAKRLGLILEHDLSDERFFYVMRYVPGESLNLVTQRLHAASGGGGLGKRELRESLEYGCDLLRTLCHYHSGGLWHKDVKPDNIIVHDGQAHLVDFGLITPLRSSMTLTTHGTEYFRDPEMVRMALKGVKVHEVDGAKFDVYAAGAVLYSVIENSFPAHGGLSQITRPCPEAVRWVVRRAMTDYDKRYDSAAAMLGDLEAVLASSDPFAMKPVDLPSMRGAEAGVAMPAPVVQAAVFVPPIPVGAAVGAGAPAAVASVAPGAPGVDDWRQAGRVPPGGFGGAPAGAPGYVAGSPVPPAAEAPGRVRPNIRVTDWWKGRYVVEGGPARAPGARPTGARAGVQGVSFVPPVPGAGARRPGTGLPASEQLKRARERAHAARERARERMHRRQKGGPANVNAGIGVAVLLFLVVCVAGGFFMLRKMSAGAFPSRVIIGQAGTPDVPTPPDRPVPVETARWDAHVRDAERTADSIAEHWRHADGERVLVVCEWSKFPAAERQAITERLQRLQDSGFKLMGDTGTASADPDEAKAQTEAVAELRKALGTRLVASDDGAKAVHDWLDSDERADLALWVTTAKESRGDGPLSWLVPSGRVDEKVVALARQTLLGKD